MARLARAFLDRENPDSSRETNGMDQVLNTLRTIFLEYGINLGFIVIRYYGIILMFGALAGAMLAERIARARGMDPERVWDAFLWILVGGVVGARIWHIFTPPASMVAAGMDTYFYLTHPFNAIDVRNGGLGIPGAIIGGCLALYWYCRRNKMSFAVFADVAVPALALGQAIGRWGNFVNNELYGQPMPADFNPGWFDWLFKIPEWARLPGHLNDVYYQPIFLYESLLSLVNLGILLYIGSKLKAKLQAGDVMLVYLVNYGLIRFCLEFLRLDWSPVAGINVNQTLALFSLLLGVGMLLWRHVISPRYGPEKRPIVE
jgi:phosphatidylglycerol---prolipoprotein diacylglyceryl transferase